MKPLIVPFFISHRGCPHQCVFCDQRTITGRRGELPSPDEIRSTIARYAATGRGRLIEVAFYGGSFTSLPRSVQDGLLQPLQLLLATGEVTSVRLSTRPDAVDGETAPFLRDRGVATIELGVQSMDDRVLALAGRGHGAAETERAFALLGDAGIAVGGQLMPGLPGDTPELAMASLHRLLALRPASLRIYPTVVIEGTPLADLWRRGEFDPFDVETAVSLCAAMLRACAAAGVPVVRVGLQPTEELLAPGTVLAGPWHPAFRQLVEGELWFELLLRLTTGLAVGSSVELVGPSSRVSDLVGQGRRNLRRLEEQRGVRVSKVASDHAAAPHTLAVTRPDGIATGTLFG